ncbi:UDP-glucose 4-epimerase [Brucella melitensis]|uniref:Uncharacterized protein n=6 Tax=Brucella TaxID=234 RepID=Q2YQ13_BRUA2|nr:hypothetical protein BR1065 [Brucella suis 1330]ABY38166.1 Hypothetical protein, conserved [Brucella suis ATCC 23445]ACU48049.1 hypothetical protein BMI_I1070 [Brucella microti CCM 4915]AEK54380.1 hypothetical protein BPI_I1108 [Brucella pinnipedialis B2/94]AEU06071.1 hypothetical protein BSVBI22_A1061 [Brucella suis VBI22]AHN46694.1 hypothetical protein BSS2_I1037 [Brucella suis bv. 1 str. S2]AQQ57335.1 UDP-glucose 4-epimerase [Brucella melitensis]ASU71713.1 UDP-glucose 4-epimerase [Bruc
MSGHVELAIEKSERLRINIVAETACRFSHSWLGVNFPAYRICQKMPEPAQ